MRSLLLLTGFASLLFEGALGQDESSAKMESLEEYQARMQSAFQEAFDMQNQSFALWIGLSDPDYGDLYFTFGNSTGGPPPDMATTLEQRFDIGSISKSMGGTVILRLVEEGIMSLSDTVQDILPDFSVRFPEYANNTMDELLRMLTLVPDFLNDENGILNDQTLDLSKRYTIEEVVEYALQQNQTRLGTYSTTNFLVAQLMAETVTNRSMAEMLQEYVWKPLGMNTTYLPDRFSPGGHPEPVATPYAGPLCIDELQRTGFGDVEVYQDMTEISYTIVMSGIGGAINSNIYDLLAWAKSGTGDALLQPETVQLRSQRIVGAPYVETYLDYGIAQYRYASFLFTTPSPANFFQGWVGHGGDAFGFDSKAFRNDGLNASFASAGNTCNYVEVQELCLKIFTEELVSRNTDNNSTTTTLEPTLPVDGTDVPGQETTSPPDNGATETPGDNSTDTSPESSSPSLMMFPFQSYMMVMMMSTVVVLPAAGFL